MRGAMSGKKTPNGNSGTPQANPERSAEKGDGSQPRTIGFADLQAISRVKFVRRQYKPAIHPEGARCARPI
jgi:hypothetical protein